jgi:hypothetical protein
MARASPDAGAEWQRQEYASLCLPDFWVGRAKYPPMKPRDSHCAICYPAYPQKLSPPLLLHKQASARPNRRYGDPCDIDNRARCGGKPQAWACASFPVCWPAAGALTSVRLRVCSASEGLVFL